MKNKDKYATAEEAYRAWYAFCKAQPSCSDCKYEHCDCFSNWIYDEAEEDNNEAKEPPQWQNNLMEKFTSKE